MSLTERTTYTSALRDSRAAVFLLRDLRRQLGVGSPEEVLAAVRAIRDLLGEQNAILADALKAIEVQPIEGETFASAAAGELRRLRAWQDEAIAQDELTIAPVRTVVAELGLGSVGENIGQVAADEVRRARQANLALAVALTDVGVLAQPGETFAEAAAAELRRLHLELQAARATGENAAAAMARLHAQLEDMQARDRAIVQRAKARRADRTEAELGEEHF